MRCASLSEGTWGSEKQGSPMSESHLTRLGCGDYRIDRINKAQNKPT